MARILFGVLAVAGLLFAQTASAVNQPEQYLHLAGYGVYPDDVRRVDGNGIGVDVAFGRQLRNQLFGELRAFRVAMETGPSPREAYYDSGFGLDLRYRFGTRHQLSAFVLGGVALAFNDISGSGQDETGLQLSVATGLVSRPLTQSKIRLRLEGRILREDFLDEVVDLRFGLGIEVPFDPAETIVREVLVNNPAPSQAILEPTSYPPRPVDSDQDGVLDNFDACKSTMPGTKVDRSGCAIQAALSHSAALPFRSGNADLTPTAQRLLDIAARQVQDEPRSIIQLFGSPANIAQTSAQGTLTRSRLQNVSQYLVKTHGLTPDRLSIVTEANLPPDNVNTIRIQVNRNANLPGSANPQ